MITLCMTSLQTNILNESSEKGERRETDERQEKKGIRSKKEKRGKKKKNQTSSMLKVMTCSKSSWPALYNATNRLYVP